MCTVSWVIDSNGYDLFFSRDELRTRSIALPPEIHLSESMPYIAPIDPDGGGTWIAVNSNGVCLFLLNNYQSSYMPTEEIRKSRGLICDTLIHHGTVAEAEHHLLSLALQVYPPFSLGMLEPDRSCKVFDWDGERLHKRVSPTSPLASSSSPNWEEIKRWRREKLKQMTTPGGTKPTTKQLYDFHCFHDPAQPAASACMRRPEAKTVSLSHVSLTSRAISFRYMNGSPDKNDWQSHVVLLRNTASTERMPILSNHAE